MKQFSIESIQPVEPQRRQIIVREGFDRDGILIEVHDETDGGYRAEATIGESWMVTYGDSFQELSQSIFEGFERFYDGIVTTPDTICLRYKDRTTSYTLV